MDSLDKELYDILGQCDELTSIIRVSAVLTLSTPVTESEANYIMEKLDSGKAELSSIYFQLSREISRLESEVQKDYDSSYSRLVRLGRPSKDAIEAEIRNGNPTYVEVSCRIKSLEDVKELISMYMRSIDSKKTSVLEALRSIKKS